MIGPEPAGTPEVERVHVTSEPSVRRLQLRQRLLLFTHNRRRVILLIRELQTRLDGVTKDRGEILGREEPVFLPSRAARASTSRLPAYVRRRRTYQAVARHPPMIETRQRLVCRERRQPQRESRDLHGCRVQVDAEQAALRNLAPKRNAIGGG